MSDQPLFSPAMVLGIPPKNQKVNNFKEATKTSEKLKSEEEMKTKKSVEEQKTESSPMVDKPKVKKEKLKVESDVELVKDKTVKPQSKLNGRLRTNYFIDKNIIRYIDNISGEMKFNEIQNYYSQTVAEEFLKISQVLYERYKHKLVDTIMNGDQIAEFILREFRKEFNIVTDG